jgi:hypothetical protein
MELAVDRRFDEAAVPTNTRPPSEVLTPSPSHQPYTRLMLAVLEGAVSDVQKYATAHSGRGRRIFAEAEAWIAAAGTGRPFDFETVCEALGFDPSSIRAGLQRWCTARRNQAVASRTVLRFPFCRTSGMPTWWSRGFACMSRPVLEPPRSDDWEEMHGSSAGR